MKLLVNSYAITNLSIYVYTKSTFLYSQVVMKHAFKITKGDVDKRDDTLI